MGLSAGLPSFVGSSLVPGNDSYAPNRSPRGLSNHAKSKASECKVSVGYDRVTLCRRIKFQLR